MSEDSSALKAHKETSKGGHFGLFLNRTHAPLLTTTTKPYNVTPKLSPFLTSHWRERRSPLTKTDLYSSPLAVNPTADGKATEDVQALNLAHLHKVPVHGKTVELSDEIKLSEKVLKTGSGEQQGKVDRRHADELYSYPGISKLGVPNNETVSSLSTAGHDTVSMYLDSLEHQVIPQELHKEVHQTALENSPRKGYGTLSSSSSFRKSHGRISPQCDSTKRNSIPTPRSHTDSVCSNCSGEDSVNGQSRCSVCDGNSAISSGRHHTVENDSGFLDHIDSVIGNESRVHCPLFATQEFVNEEELSRYVFREEDFDCSSCKCSFSASQIHSSGKHSRNSSGEDIIGKKPRTVCLTKEQLVFLLQRVELSRYRLIMEERLADQSSMTKSQQKTIACLIQAVIIINKRVHSETDWWIKIQADVKQLQRERTVCHRRQAKLSMCMCAILCLYLLNFESVRERLHSIIRYFGIVETVKKINRTRKMIAENWRNIPSLLTNFWRIFIFRNSQQAPGCLKLE